MWEKTFDDSMQDQHNKLWEAFWAYTPLYKSLINYAAFTFLVICDGITIINSKSLLLSLKVDLLYLNLLVKKVAGALFFIMQLAKAWLKAVVVKSARDVLGRSRYITLSQKDKKKVKC